MDMNSACGMPVSKDLKNLPSKKDLNKCCELPVDPSVSSPKRTGALCMCDLRTCLSDFPSTRDNQKVTSLYLEHSDGEDITNIVKDDISSGSNESLLDSVTSEKGLTKSATFPCGKNDTFVVSISCGNEDGKEHLNAEVLAEKGSALSACNTCPSSISLPAPRKLVSAMKGSREKQGIPPTKLTVKWAPDVYDPLPSAVSHVPSSKSHRQRAEGRKHGKNKHKWGGRSSRGGKGKDKKQVRKHGGSSNRCFKSLEDNERIIESEEQPVELVGFDVVGSPESFCGRSFLKNSVTKLHFPVAEAT